MDFFNILSLFGGLALFLYGMRQMGDSLKEDTSGTLKSFMGKITNNPIKAFLLGLAVTAIIQSSTATIVITSGLVAASIITLRQSLGVIIGANVGTTVTGQIIRLLDVNAGSSSFLRILQPSSLAPIALIIGIVCIMFLRFKNHNTVGNIAMGFGILFTGLMTMTASVSVLSESGALDSLFSTIGDNLWLGYLVGLGVALLLQSSSASIGILQAFALASTITFNVTFVVLIGIYLGDCLTTAIVCSIGAAPDARRVGFINILYNLGKTALILIVVNILHLAGALDSIWYAPMTSGSIANINTIFNLVCALALLPTIGIMEKISYRVIKDPPTPVNKYAELSNTLNPVFFTTPALALNSCYQLLNTMLTAACDNVNKAIDAIFHYDEKKIKEVLEEEDNIDALTDAVSSYMEQLSPYLKEDNQMRILFEYTKLATSFERLGDHAVNITEIATAMDKEKISFSAAAKEEILLLQGLLTRIFAETKEGFQTRSLPAARKIEPLEETMDDLINALHDNHVERLHKGICKTRTGIQYLDLLSNIERMSDICSNVGIAIIARIDPQVASVAHSYITTLHQGNDTEYVAQYHAAHDEYFGELKKIQTAYPLESAL